MIHLVRPTTKEEKTTEYDVNSHDNVLVSNQRSMRMGS